MDGLFCAEALHWFDGVAALKEIERVLRPRAGLVLMWNVVAKATEPSVAAPAELIDRRGLREGRARRYLSGEWREAFAGSSFEPLRELTSSIRS